MKHQQLTKICWCFLILCARIAFDAAKEGDKYALEVVDNYCMYLTEGLLDICNGLRNQGFLNQVHI